MSSSKPGCDAQVRSVYLDKPGAEPQSSYFTHQATAPKHTNSTYQQARPAAAKSSATAVSNRNVSTRAAKQTSTLAGVPSLPLSCSNADAPPGQTGSSYFAPPGKAAESSPNSQARPAAAKSSATAVSNRDVSTRGAKQRSTLAGVPSLPLSCSNAGAPPGQPTAPTGQTGSSYFAPPSKAAESSNAANSQVQHMGPGKTNQKSTSGYAPGPPVNSSPGSPSAMKDFVGKGYNSAGVTPVPASVTSPRGQAGTQSQYLMNQYPQGKPQAANPTASQSLNQGHQPQSPGPAQNPGQSPYLNQAHGGQGQAPAGHNNQNQNLSQSQHLNQGQAPPTYVNQGQPIQQAPPPPQLVHTQFVQQPQVVVAAAPPPPPTLFVLRSPGYLYGSSYYGGYYGGYGGW